jgi:hypothetical protein
VAMIRRWGSMIAGGIVMVSLVPAAVFGADTAASNDNDKVSNQVQQHKQPTERDVQSRGLFSKKKKKKKIDGGAAARSQPSDRSDSSIGHPPDPPTP